MAQKDIISKRLVKRIALDMAHYLFKLRIDEAELLETERQRVEHRQADVLMRVTAPEQYLLHIEIQNDHHPQMPQRMLRYRADIAFSYPDDEVLQYLIYIGKAPLRMPSQFKRRNLDYHYNIIDMQQLDCREFLHQDTPDALVLAILCDFKDNSAEEVVHHILSRLQILCKDDESQYRDYFAMLELLSSNRDLMPLVKEQQNMLSQVELTRLPSYELGMEKGVQQGHMTGWKVGREEGRQEGEHIGHQQGLVEALRIQLEAKFGEIPPEMIQKLNIASITQLQTWLKRATHAQQLETLFQDDDAQSTTRLSR